LVSQSTIQRAPGVQRGLQAGERVAGIGLVAVEEMLGVEQRLAPLGDQMRDGGRDVLDVFVERDAERLGDVEVMGLADEADGGVPAFRTPASTSSLSAERPARLVMPKAVMVARVSGAASKNALSVGFAPGQPPSM
jgi:hypothetical protein